MSAIDRIVSGNAEYAAGYGGAPGGRPAQRLAIVTCMDTRLDPLPAFGLDVGDAHILRNAGGLITEDMLRSLTISQRALGTTEIAVVHHTKCGMEGFDDDAFRYTLIGETSAFPPWRVDGFDDAYEQARRSIESVRTCPFLPHRGAVRGFVFDVDSASITEVE